MTDRPQLDLWSLRHNGDCGVHNATPREHATSRDCTCGAVIAWYEMILQAIFDVENQPSQFGTTLNTAENERLRAFALSFGRCSCEPGQCDTKTDFQCRAREALDGMSAL